MIYHRGHLKPTPAQRKALRTHADDSFTAVIPADFGPVPEHPDYLVERRTMIGLACVCVGPHDDTWLGSHEESDVDGPAGRRAIFWMVDAPASHRLYLQVGTDYAAMSVGDWVVFDDRVLHSVTSTRKWRACAYQVRPGPQPAAILPAPAKRLLSAA